ncbi:MAG: pseudaminic acid synthase [Gammaproteobacteria bacterium]
MQKEVILNGRRIGRGHPPYMVAEMSANHLGEQERAFRILEAAVEAGADAVKLQTYTADTLTIDHDGEDFAITEGPWAGRTLYDLYTEASTPWEWHEALFEKGRQLGITVFSAPFDPTAVDFLETLDCPAYKIASFEAHDTPLIEKAAATGKPLIISTGITDRDEVRQAVAAARRGGCRQLVLLHCVSAYPTPAGESHLRKIASYEEEFGLPTGLSDHTTGTAVPVAAIALGAAMIEKHLTLDRSEGGPDALFSLEPDEFGRMCRDCYTAWESLGDPDGISPSVEASRIFRRSLYVVEDVRAGEILSEYNVRSIRPGGGLAPRHLSEVCGRTFNRDVPRGTPLDWSMLEP